MEGIDESGEIRKENRDEVDRLIKAHFRPEFLNRLDEIVFYKPLTKSEITSIIDLILNKLAERLNDKQLNLEVSDSAKAFISDNAYDPVYGARPLKRYIQSKIETAISRLIISEDPQPESTIIVDAEDEKLKVLLK